MLAVSQAQLEAASAHSKELEKKLTGIRKRLAEYHSKIEDSKKENANLKEQITKLTAEVS